jgi:translocation and assembly module TamA
MRVRSRWRHLGVVVVPIALVACGPPPPVHHPGEEYVDEVVLRGNHAIEDDDLTLGLAVERALAAGRGLDPYELSLDAGRVRGVYLRRGYFDVDVRATVERHGLAVTPVFTIVEGARATLVRVDVIGLPADPALGADDLRARIPIAIGAPFDYDAYDDAKPAVIAAIEDAGYAHARVDSAVVADRARHEAVIRIEIDPGPRCVFGAITMHGFDGDLAGLADAATARLAIAPGQPFSNQAVAASQVALYELGRFSTVRVDADRAADGAVIPVTIAVAGAARHELRTGIGVGVDQVTYLIRPHVGYSVAGWPWTMTNVDTDLRPALAMPRDDPSSPAKRFEALASLTRLDLFRPRVKGELSILLQYLTIEAFTSYGPRVRAGLSSPVGSPRVQVSAGVDGAVLFFQDPDVDAATGARIGIDHDEHLVMADQSIAVDLRDQPLEPRLGVYAALRLGEGRLLGASPSSFVQLAPDLRGYVPLGPLVLSAHARVGAFAGAVPPTERYFSGGASSQRGFPERQLSPSVTGVGDRAGKLVVIGGGGLIETGVEARVAFVVWHQKLEPAVFLDGGDVTERAADLDPTHLHWAAGGGLRYVTPYGAVRFDVGYRLNRVGEGEPPTAHRYAYQLGFGEAF